MNYRLIESREIVWCPSDDRYILVVKQDDKVIGLNYMQGDELEDFKKYYSNVDEKLTDFYNSVEPYLGGASEFDRINQAIWAYYEYKNLRDERKAL